MILIGKQLAVMSGIVSLANVLVWRFCGMSEQSSQEREESRSELADKAYEKATSLLPEGNLKKVLKEIGDIGPYMAIPVAYIPPAFLVPSLPISLTSWFENYWTIFVVTTPFVVFSMVLAYIALTGKTVPGGAGVYVIGALLFYMSIQVSMRLGGVVPDSIPDSVPAGSPPRLAAYLIEGFLAYILSYGLIPCIGGAVLGYLCARWLVLVREA
jgi:hypothetical protein